MNGIIPNETAAPRRIVLCENGRENFTAGVKAPADVLRIAINSGYRSLCVDGCVPTREAGVLTKVWCRIKWAWVGYWAIRKFCPGDVVLLPEKPGFLCRKKGFAFLDVLRKKGIKFIFVVHDIHGLRMPPGPERDKALFEFLKLTDYFDVLIVHNAAMRRWLSERGVDDRKLIELSLFDYLTDVSAGGMAKGTGTGMSRNMICLAGNLSTRKSRWLNAIGEVKGVEWCLFGPYYEEVLAERASVGYFGCFSPDELPLKLSGAFGLVWDGDSIETCSGAWGEYERFNNPHKLSLYLAAGMPVIVWSEAATAPFVRRHNIGICVSSLVSLGEIIRSVGDEQYAIMKENCKKISEAVREGSFMSNALSLAEKMLKSN